MVSLYTKHAVLQLNSSVYTLNVTLCSMNHHLNSCVLARTYDGQMPLFAYFRCIRVECEY